MALAVALDRFWGNNWQSPALTAWCMIGVGFLMLFFDSTCMTVKRIEHAGYGDALLLGCMQAAAFVPGVGRIAASIAIARLLGYERPDAARFAFLIWMPILIGSCAWHAPALLALKPFPTAEMIAGFVPEPIIEPEQTIEIEHDRARRLVGEARRELAKGGQARDAVAHVT